MKTKAVIVGASGLVGSHLLDLLLQNNQFDEIRCFSRKKLPIKHQKLIQFEIDFQQPGQIMDDFTGDVVFCCVGTTIKNAGSKEKFRSVDYEIPCELAKLAENKLFKSFVVISSLGADPESTNFYLKTKGQMQQCIEMLKIPQKVFIQPSLLLGKRPEFRFGERIGEIVMRSFGFLLIGKLRKYRAIRAEIVALSMIKIALDNKFTGPISSDLLVKIANS
jgi:uncharacterized protein YbjT (DUF2867 family)